LLGLRTGQILVRDLLADAPTADIFAAIFVLLLDPCHCRSGSYAPRVWLDLSLLFFSSFDAPLLPINAVATSTPFSLLGRLISYVTLSFLLIVLCQLFHL